MAAAWGRGEIVRRSLEGQRACRRAEKIHTSVGDCPVYLHYFSVILARVVSRPKNNPAHAPSTPKGNWHGLAGGSLSIGCLSLAQAAVWPA